MPDDTKQALQDATNWAIGAFTDAKNAASDFATGIADSLKDFAGKAWDGTKELAGKAWDSAKGAAAAIGTTAGKAWDGAKDTLSRGYHTLTDFFTGGKKEEKEKAPLAVPAEKGPAKAPSTETAPVASSSPSIEKPVLPAVSGMQAPKIQLTKPAALTMPVASALPAPAPKPAAGSSPAPVQAPTQTETVPAATATGTKPAGTSATGRSAEEILSGIAGTLSEMAEAQEPLAKDVHKLADDFATVFDPDAVRNTRMLQELMTANGTLSANQLSGANAAPYTPGGAGIVPQGSSGFLPTGTAKRSADARMGEEVKAKVVAAAQAKGINPDLALALIQQESGGDVNSTMHNTNGTTDWGLMQVNDAVIADYNRKHGTNLDPRHNINDNITVGMDELAGHLQKWGGDVDKALLAYNRGYVLESAGEADQLIYEAVNAVVRDEKKARAIADSWRLDVPDLREALFESEGDLADAEIKRHELEKTCDRLTSEKSELVLKNTRMSDELAGMQRRFDAATASLLARQTELKRRIEDSDRNLRAVLEGLRTSAPFFIPEKAMHGMLEGDFSKARAIFEQARHMDLSQFPLPGAEERRERSIVPATPVGGDEKIKKFGTPEWGWNTEV